MRKYIGLATALLLVMTSLAALPTANAAIYMNCGDGWERFPDNNEVKCCMHWTRGAPVCEVPEDAWAPVACSAKYNPWTDGVEKLWGCIV